MLDQYYTHQPPQMARKPLKTVANKSVSDGHLWSGRKKFPVSSNLDEFTIDPSKCGEDSRTTVMIKNIPNKYTKQLLLQQLNINYKDAYDFFYLPIDFKNQCNMGYAFLNFVDAKFIKPFYEELNDKKWEKFNSEKVCRISYARIQGRSQLELHFRDSSVMNQNDINLKPYIIKNLAELVKNQKSKEAAE